MSFSEDKIRLLKDANLRLRLSDDLSQEKNKRLVIIYTPPKVGSTTLVSSFRLSAGKRLTILHIHGEKMLEVLCGIKDVSINEIIRYNRILGKDIYIFDVYRTPIELKLSMFFERICDYHFNNIPEKLNKYDMQKIITRFNNIFNFLSNEDYYRNVYDITVPDAFDFNKKYLLQQVDGVKYIKLRLSNADKWNEQIREIMGIDIKIIKDYETDNKQISELYKRMKNVYRIPENKLIEIEESDSFCYYNNEEERKTYISKWTNKKSEMYEGYTPEQYELYKKISGENKWMVSIQMHHYIDEGCVCDSCEKRRRDILTSGKMSISADGSGNDRVIHSQIIKTNISEDIKKKKREILRAIVMNNQRQLQQQQFLKNSGNIIKNRWIK